MRGLPGAIEHGDRIEDACKSGAGRIRTADLLDANEALSQLSHSPTTMPSIPPEQAAVNGRDGPGPGGVTVYGESTIGGIVRMDSSMEAALR